jgi:broad-specificity NMP kinase
MMNQEQSYTTDDTNIPILDPALGRMLEQIRIRAKRRVAWLRKLWSEEGESGANLVVTHAIVDTYLDDLDSPESEALWYSTDERVSQWNRELAEIEAEIAADKESRLAQLRTTFGLSSEEFDLLQVCLAPLLATSLARVYAYLHDHAGRGYATEELAARLFGYGRKSLWTSESPLRRWELVSEKDTGPGEPTQLICDRLISDWVQGRNCLDELLVGIAEIRPPLTPLKDWPVDRALSFLRHMASDDNSRVRRICVVGTPGSGRRTFAAVVSSRMNLSLLAINADQIDERDWQRVFIRSQRQANLDRCALAWHGENATQRVWPQVAPLFPIQFVVCEAGQEPLPIPEVIDQTIELPMPALEERRELWRRFVPISVTWPEEKFGDLLTQHRVSIGDVISVSHRNVQTVAEAADIVREAGRNRLGDLAQLLECPFDWDDLVITSKIRDTLEDFAFEARERAAFWEQDNARRLFPQGRGLLGLFSGSPGTGKTMAAQVIAADLGLDLFRIDLSTIVSKYVGETSKNLERVLSRAAQMDVVLLFDEADALFGKRTEIRDAHDRFANTDTGYLLQAIESYQGVAVLATNKKGNIDSAFIRRIRYALEFPKPDAKQREEIWRKVIGKLADANTLERLASDLTALAVNLDLTGAQIKFAVLAAIFVAKRDGKSLAVSHLLRGIDRELMKEGRALSGRDRGRLLGPGA